MNTKVRATLLGVAGAALLIGTGATLALWTDEAVLPPDTLALGALAVEASDLVWTDVSPDVDGDPVIDPAGFLLVPGDEVLGTAPVDVTLVGETLRAVLTLDDGADLPAWVDWDVRFTTADGAVVEQVAADASDVVDVAVRVGLPITTTAHQDEAIDLSSLRVRLDQTTD